MDDPDDHKELWQSSDDTHKIIFLYGEIKKLNRYVSELYALSRNTLNFEKVEKSIKFWGGLIAATLILFAFVSRGVDYINTLTKIQQQQLELEQRRDEEHRYRPTQHYYQYKIVITPYYYDGVKENIYDQTKRFTT